MDWRDKYTPQNPMVAYCSEDFHRAKNEGIPVVRGLSMSEQAEKDAYEHSERNREISENSKLKSDVAEMKTMLETLVGKNKPKKVKQVKENKNEQGKPRTSKLLERKFSSSMFKDLVACQPKV